MEDFFGREAEKNKINEGRFIKFEEWLKDHSFHNLMARLKEEHNEAYRDKCYKRGCEPNSNNKLSFIYAYLKANFETIHDYELEDEDFSTEMYFFKGFHFVTIYGQGAFDRIYKDKKIYFQV